MRFLFVINFFVLFCFFTASSCGKKKNKKYEEDPDFSKLSPNKRIQGIWFMDDFTFNGQSQVSKFNSMFKSGGGVINSPIDIKQFGISGIMDDSQGQRIEIILPLRNIPEANFDQEFINIPRTLSSRDSFVNMSFYSPMHFKEFNHLPDVVSWRVTKLFENNMNIVLDVDSGQYKYFFSKK